MDNRFVPLEEDEVLFVKAGRILMENPTFKVSEFLDALAQAISDRELDWSEAHESWFADGLPCDAMRLTGSGWQRGRVRIRLEFSPAKPQESLPEHSSSRERVRIQARTIESDDLDEFDLP